MHASKWTTNYSGRAEPATARGGSIFPLAGLLQRLNELGGRHGIGRLDLVENRFVGMKSRGVYETPGGTIQQAAHRAIESLTLDRGAAHPESEMLQALIDKSQDNVGGVVRLKLYKGSATVVGRRSPKSLHSLAHVTFEEDAVYDQRDAEGFIKLNALRLAARRGAFNVEPPWAGEGRDAGKAAPRDGTEES